MYNLIYICKRFVQCPQIHILKYRQNYTRKKFSQDKFNNQFRLLSHKKELTNKKIRDFIHIIKRTLKYYKSFQCERSVKKKLTNNKKKFT